QEGGGHHHLGAGRARRGQADRGPCAAKVDRAGRGEKAALGADSPQPARERSDRSNAKWLTTTEFRRDQTESPVVARMPKSSRAPSRTASRGRPAWRLAPVVR